MADWGSTRRPVDVPAGADQTPLTGVLGHRDPSRAAATRSSSAASSVAFLTTTRASDTGTFQFPPPRLPISIRASAIISTSLLGDRPSSAGAGGRGFFAQGLPCTGRPPLEASTSGCGSTPISRPPTPRIDSWSSTRRPRRRARVGAAAAAPGLLTTIATTRSPRVGAIWDPLKGRPDVGCGRPTPSWPIAAGHQRRFMDDHQSAARDTAHLRGDPIRLLSALAGRQSIGGLAPSSGSDPDFEGGRMHTWNVNVERQL